MLELGYSGPSGSAFGTKAGAGPEENIKEPVLWVTALAGATGAGKAAGSGAWDRLEVETGGGSRDPSEGQEAADTSLGLKKSRSDDGSFWNRCHGLFPADSLGAVGAGSVRPRQRSSSSSKERALFVLSGPEGASAWLDERLRGGPEVWGGGGRIGMPEVGGAGAGANTGDELLGVSNSARSMRAPWLLQ